MSKTLREQITELTAQNGTLRTELAEQKAAAENSRAAADAAEHEAASVRQQLVELTAERDRLAAEAPKKEGPFDPFAAGASVVRWAPSGEARKFATAGELAAAMHEGEWFDSPAKAKAAAEAAR